jgi:hypothetical protein
MYYLKEQHLLNKIALNKTAQMTTQHKDIDSNEQAECFQGYQQKNHDGNNRKLCLS